MLRLIDYSNYKKSLHSSGEYITVYRCACECCEVCWFREDIGQCIFGGPYSGYIQVGDDSQSCDGGGCGGDGLSG